MEAVGTELRRLRQQHELSIRQLAEVVGVRHDVINRVESGRWIPSETDAARLVAWMTHPSQASHSGDTTGGGGSTGVTR